MKDFATDFVIVIVSLCHEVEVVEKQNSLPRTLQTVNKSIQ